MVEKMKKYVLKGKGFFRTDRGMLLSLVFLYPLGLYLVFKKSKWSKTNKIISSVVAGLFLIVLLHNNYLASVEASLSEKLMTVEEKLRFEEEQVSRLEQVITGKETDLTTLVSETDAYKAKMQPYEKLSEEDAKKKLADLKKAEEQRLADEAAKKKAVEKEKRDKEAQKKAAADKKAKEQQAAEAEKKRLAEEEEARGYETGITYNELARTPDDFLFSKVKFSGKVVQVMEGADSIQIRLAVDGNYDTILYGEYENTIVSSRVLEDDYITISGLSSGLTTYKSTMGGSITIPSVLIKVIE